MKVTLMKGWYSVKEAAKYCDISERTLRNWLRNGLRYSMVNRKILIKLDWLNGYLESFEVTNHKLETLADEVIAKVKAA